MALQRSKVQENISEKYFDSLFPLIKGLKRSLGCWIEEKGNSPKTQSRRVAIWSQVGKAEIDLRKAQGDYARSFHR